MTPWQLLAEHQALGTLFVVGRKLDGESVNAGRRDNLKGILPGRLRGAENAKEGAGDDEEPTGQPRRRPCVPSGACRQCDVRPSAPLSGRTSAAIMPFGPGP